VGLRLSAGLQISEIIQLHLLDGILDERKRLVIVSEGKDTKRCEVPLNAKALLDHLEVRPYIDNEFHFVGQRNEGVKEKTVQRSVERFAKAAGLDGLTPHVLRHRFAKTLVDSG